MSKCENQILYQKSIKLLIQIAILYQKEALFQSNSQTPQTIQFIDILEFDDNINSCLLKSKQFIDQKKQTLLDIGQDYFDLKKVNFDLLKLFQFRQEIYISLQDLIKKQIQSLQLHFLIDIYENYLSPETQLSQLLIRINKKNILNQKYKDIQIDGKKCYAFISLSENIGQVIKVSNNFDQIVPNTSNVDVIGKNINFMQPSSIAKAHDAILKNYLTKFKSKNSSMHLNQIIGIDQDNWAIPYQIKLQTCQIDNNNYGVCAQINLIEDFNQYILIDQAKHYEIITVSQKFYKQILEQSISKQTVSHIQINQIIPCLPELYSNIKESKNLFTFNQIDQTKQKNINSENFTTIMIKPQDKNQLGWMKNPNFDDLNDSNFLELDIYAIKGEMSSIENQFVHLIQLKIFEIIQIQEIHEKIEQLQNVFQILKKSSIQKSNFQNIAISQEQIQPQQSKQFLSENIVSSFRNINNHTLTDQFVRQTQVQSESSYELPLENLLNQRIEAQIALHTKPQAFSPLNRFKVTQGEDYLNENNLELTRVTQILSPQNSCVVSNSKQLFQLNSTDREMIITSRNQIEQLSLLNKKRLSKQISNFQNEFNNLNTLKQKSLNLNYYIENHKQKSKNKKQQEQDQNNLINEFNQKNDYSNINWSSHLQSPIAEIIADNVFNRTFFLPFFGIPLKQQIQLREDLYYQLHYNYNTTKDSIWKYMKSDKSTTQLYNIVLNENIDYTFLYSLTRYDIHSVNFGYALEMIYALSYDVVNGLDFTTQNLLQIGLNLVSISQALTRFKNQAGDLMNVYEFCIITSTLRIPMIMYKIQGSLSQSYISMINQEIQKVDEILKTVYGLVDKVYNDKRYEQQSFKNFVMQALQDNSCLIIQQNLNLLNNPKFQLQQCNSIANGIFQKGLIQVVKLQADLYVQRSNQILNSNMLTFYQLLNQQKQDLSEIDHFYLRIYLEQTIQCIESKVAQITYDHYNYMINMNYMIFTMSIIAFLILIYISFFKFFEYSIGQIRQSKLLLNLLDIKTIEENQYILTYLQIQR
ncbi:hypothetical protein ABPG74_004239 [Tetrahymena malaccensis]